LGGNVCTVCVMCIVDSYCYYYENYIIISFITVLLVQIQTGLLPQDSKTRGEGRLQLLGVGVGHKLD